MATAGAQQGPVVPGLRLPAAGGVAWVWARRLLLLVGGTAAVWLALLAVSGQAHAEPPPVLAPVADAPAVAEAASLPSNTPTLATPTLATPTSDTPPLTPSSVAADATGALTGTAVPPAADAPLSALDQLSGPAVAVPVITSTGDHGDGVLARVVAPETSPESAGSAPLATPKELATSISRAHVRSGHSAPLRGTTSHGDVPPLALTTQAGSGDASSAAGIAPVSVAAPASPRVPASPASASLTHAGPAPLGPPPTPGPCAVASSTAVAGSGGNDRLDVGTVLTGRDVVQPVGSAGVPTRDDVDAIRGQGRPEPRPD